AGTAVLEAHVFHGTLEQARGHTTRLLLHGRRCLQHRVARVDGDTAGAGAVAVGDEARVAAAHANIVEACAEVLGADLGEDRLVPLAGGGDADEHLDVTALVHLHGGPLAGA